MNDSPHETPRDFETLRALRRAAREIFSDALASADAGEAVSRAVRLEDERLSILDTSFDLRARPLAVYSVAVGKAAAPMANALDRVLGQRLVAGVISTSTIDAGTSQATPAGRWRAFAGGHPLPNEASLDAARASLKLLSRADAATDSLVIFLISGGGSAMLEWPRDERVTLSDLRETNRVLVGCGASIAEINAVRRALSAVKGGGLGARIRRAAQVTLIVSDTNTGDEASVASGLTLSPPADAPDASEVIARYNLAARLSVAVLHAVEQERARAQRQSPATPAKHSSQMHSSAVENPSQTGARSDALRRHYVLLDNERVMERAAAAARARGFSVELARDLVEQPVEEGASALVSRLRALRLREAARGRAVCLVSGGEFACPVRGRGTGGRNSETALRCAFELERQTARTDIIQAARTDVTDAAELTDAEGEEMAHVVALSAGTDGIDGNSPAAGALADTITLRRARELNLDARRYLDTSDAHTLFQALGDTIDTGATGTNVRDLRILLAK